VSRFKPPSFTASRKNVDDLLFYNEERYKKILDNISAFESMLRYTFNALLSGHCLDFNSFAKQSRAI
jgi:hypothetical protein